PETRVSLKLHGVTVEVVQAQDKSVKIARIHRPEDGRQKTGRSLRSPCGLYSVVRGRVFIMLCSAGSHRLQTTKAQSAALPSVL
ncbi:MAG: hypothetical protein LBU11_07285, partial [Zoogloeaceae bacterium]|nr:hypothetical protein [Zoogloeaceae bacterium]